MVTIQSVNLASQKKSPINAKNTGYFALGGMGLAMTSAISKNKTFRRQHKYFSYLAGFATLIHLVAIKSHKKQTH